MPPKHEKYHGLLRKLFILMVILLGIGAEIFVISEFVTFLDDRARMKELFISGEKTTGTIVQIASPRDLGRSTEFKHGMHFLLPVHVRFTYWAENKPFIMDTSQFFIPLPFEEEEIVPIVYDKEDPSYARIDTGKTSTQLLIFATVYFILTTLIVSITTFIFVFLAKGKGIP